jgi:hypothetical protein
MQVAARSLGIQLYVLHASIERVFDAPFQMPNFEPVAW